MEKRVFSLARSSGREIPVMLIACGTIVGLCALTGYLVRDVRYLYSGLATAVFCYVVGWANLCTDRMRKLEISDEGLFFTRRRGIGYRLRWDAIQSVRVHERSNTAEFWSVIIEDSQGHVVRVPRRCEGKDEIIHVLRQRLPENVFQVW